MTWYEAMILERYTSHGLASPQMTHAAAVDCVAQIRLGWWQVFEYPEERVVAIVGNIEGHGEVHIWADGGNLLRFGRLFMRQVWEQTPYIELMGAFMDPRMERFATWLGWTYRRTGVFGQRYWSIKRVAS